MTRPRRFFVCVEGRDGSRTTWVQPAKDDAALPVAATHAYSRESGKPLEFVRHVHWSEL